MKTLKDLAQEALDIQNASNLSGIAHSFAEAMVTLRRLLPNASTNELNTHPVAMLYADKIVDLTGVDLDQHNDNYPHNIGSAYNWAKEQVKP